MECSENSFTVYYPTVCALWRPNRHGLLQGEHPQILARMGMGMENVAVGIHRPHITEMTEGRKLLLTANSHARAFDCHEN